MSGEKLRPPRSLNLREVPAGPIREKVQEFRSLKTVEDWKKVTNGWEEGYKEIAIEIRAKSQEARNHLARSYFVVFTGKNEDFFLSGALACLTDNQLDMAIRSFTTLH